MYKNIEKQAALKLKDLIAYQEGQVVSRTLVQNEAVGMTLFSFDKGEEISTHGEVFILGQGETLVMPKDVPHAVYGEERFKMQLTVSF